MKSCITFFYTLFENLESENPDFSFHTILKSDTASMDKFYDRGTRLCSHLDLPRTFIGKINMFVPNFITLDLLELGGCYDYELCSNPFRFEGFITYEAPVKFYEDIKTEYKHLKDFILIPLP